MTNLPKRNPDNAAEIYRELIQRIRKSVKDKESIVFDPETGIQKCFLEGKLLWVKHVRNSNVTFQAELKPCKSPYCECDIGKCTHPGFYDARGEK